MDELGECNPLDDPCPAGTYCEVRQGSTICLPEGDTGRDEVCEETQTCQRGSVCLFGSQSLGKHCQQPCDLELPNWEACDIGRHTCFVAVDETGRDLPFGVCRY